MANNDLPGAYGDRLSVPTPDGSTNPLHCMIGDWLFSITEATPNDSTNQPQAINDVKNLLRLAHGILGKFGAPEKTHNIADKIGSTMLRLLVDPIYLDKPTVNIRDSFSDRPQDQDDGLDFDGWPEIDWGVPAITEQAVRHEPWTTLKFESASRIEAHYHPNGNGNNDRLINDPEHGIFGIFDGVGSSVDASDAAEIVRDFVHQTLLGAEKPTTLKDAKRLMRQVFADARLECKRRNIEGGTTANVSFAIDIDGCDYLIIGNVGDSVSYQADRDNITKLTTEQMFDNAPNYIFNSITAQPNRFNDSTDAMISKDFVVNPKTLEPPLDLPMFSPNPKLVRDEVVVVPIKRGMRFVQVSDGISGDKPHERVGASAFLRALCLHTPLEALNYLFRVSTKKDDKAGVAFFVLAA